MQTNFLDMIKSPRDLRLLKKDQLNLLASEIRQEIIQCVSKNGGHLAPSLGTVELAIALHYVFNSPVDKIIWDVGHQSYAHKLLTGRKNRFRTLRQYKGLSGFPNIFESEHDAFGVGHSSTSISAALGIAVARDLKGTQNKVIAVIGDGALTGGEAFEGLNNAGHLKKDLIVILNDNGMSIGKNVGAWSSYLHEIVADSRYSHIKDSVEGLLKRFPHGEAAAEKVKSFEDNIRALFSPGMLFKQLGFNYFGPIDGHNLDKLIQALNNIKGMKGPILLHIRTKKGKGYFYAANDKTKFHGIGSFDIDTGEKISCENGLTYTQVFSDSILRIAEKNEKIIAITAAMASGTGLDKFAEKFPKRFYDVGIAEQHAVTFAAGLAKEGFKPIVALYSTFLQRAYDQLIHDVCLQKLPVIFAIDRAGLVGEDGATHHGVFDVSFLGNVPDLVIMAPRNGHELYSMLKTAVDYKGPVAIRYPRGCIPELKVDFEFLVKPILIGKAERLRDGKDMVVLCLGEYAEIVNEIANEIKNKIDLTVVNLRFAKPIDDELIVSLARKFRKMLVIEENALIGGVGSVILELVNKHKIHVNIERIGIPDKFIEHGNTAILKKAIGLDKESIKKKILEMM